MGAHTLSNDDPAPAGTRARTLVEILAAQMGRPERPALVADGQVLTFGDLDVLTGSLGARLVRRGAGPGVRVGLAMDRCAGAVVAILAVLRTGASYVPLDPTLPTDRLEFMAADAGIGLVVAEPEAELPWLPHRTPVVRAEQFPQAGSRASEEATLAPPVTTPTSPAPSPSDEAYVIYTSGSTGRPKGCSVSHGNVVALLDAALPLFEVTDVDRWLLFHSSSFDFSVWEMWGAIATGAAGVVADSEVVRDPERLVELCRREDVSVLCVVPSVFAALGSRVDRCPSLRYVVFGGEPLRPADVRTAWQACDEAAGPQFVNMYGITETTVHVTFKALGPEDLDGDGSLTPIGAELPHLRVLVVDEDGRPVPDGQDGEIWVAGDGVAIGYVGRVGLTAERFVDVDGRRTYRSGDLGRRLPNGELAYRGRLDDQVKLRGFRVELGEVESTLREHPGVRDACAVLVGVAPGPVTLEAAVVVDPGVTAAGLRGFAATRLPAHMVPARVVPLEDLDRLGSGKVNRAAVAEHLRRTLDGDRATSFPEGAGSAEPGTTGVPGENSLTSLQGVDTADAVTRRDRVAAFLMAAWAAVLGHRDFGPDDGFFDIGGDSISIVTVHDTLAAELPEVEIRVVDLFLHPSVNALADHVAGLI